MNSARLERELQRRGLTLAFVRDESGKDFVSIELDAKRVSDWHPVPLPEPDAPVVA